MTVQGSGSEDIVCLHDTARDQEQNMRCMGDVQDCSPSSLATEGLPIII